MTGYPSIWHHPSVKYGITGGLTTILILILYYLMGVKAFTNTTYSLIVFGILFVINISLGTMAGQEEKSNQNGILPFQDAVIKVFLTFLIIVVCYHGFYYLLFNFIDPSISVETKKIMIEQMKENMAKQDIDQKTQQERIEMVKNSKLTITYSLFLMFIWAILSLIGALIIAAFIRNEPESE